MVVLLTSTGNWDNFDSITTTNINEGEGNKNDDH